MSFLGVSAVAILAKLSFLKSTAKTTLLLSQLSQIYPELNYSTFHVGEYCYLI
jgi:hypothetical protein